MARLVRRNFFIAALLATLAIARAQNPAPDLATAYSDAMQQFQAGQYTQAASALEALVARVEFSPQLEPIFYTIGSAYFNAGDYSKAIPAFKKYQAKFPNGPHAGGVAFAIAQSNLLAKNYGEAASEMSAIAKAPGMRDQALLFEAEASKAAGKSDDAIRALQELVGSEITTDDAMRDAMLLAQIFAQKGDGAGALRTLQVIHQKIALVNNVVELNSLTVDLGDKFYAKQNYKDALACYRFASPREQILRLQGDRIAAMQHQLDDNLAAARANPAEITQFAAVNNQLKEEIANAQKLLADFEKLPTITPAIYLRLGRCFYELDRKWEAIVVYEEILARFKDNPEREPALFGLIVAFADVNQPQRAEEFCEQYLRDFKNGPNAATVGYLLGAVALQAGDPKAAETYFGRILATQPHSSFREQIRYLLANAKFSEANYPEAVAAYQKYLAEFPYGANADDVRYRIALCALFAGKYQDAMNQLQDYVAKHPHSTFVPDAKYRLAVCKYAASLYDDVIADCHLARLRRQPDEEEKNLAQIATKFKPEDLSPLLLGEAGDYSLGKNQLDRAQAFYQRLLDDFPKSETVDFAYNGLGEVVFEKKDYAKALQFFDDGLNKIAAAQKLKDISVGRAKTLLALGRLEDAQKAFEQVASVREWRGEPTAFAVYSLGEIAARRDKWAEANAYFQRVYVGYQKFLPWVAKAYIGSGESFEKLGKTQEATNTYREMLRNEKLANFSETTEARKRLEALGQG